MGDDDARKREALRRVAEGGHDWAADNAHTMDTQKRRLAMRVALSVCMVVAMAFLTACGASNRHAGPTATTLVATATPAIPLAPIALSVLRFGGVANSNVAAFQMSTQDVEKIQRLYNTILNLPPYPSYGGCPNDVGIGYELTFLNGSRLVQQVMLTGGCPRVTLSNPGGCRAWPQSLTDQIAETLGVPATTIEPPSGLKDTAGPNGPFAPGIPTPPILTPK